MNHFRVVYVFCLFLFSASILQAIRYMHDHGVVHRDLKFENIMFESTAPGATIKIIDFGLSKKFIGKTGTMTERVGTIYTMSPQVLMGKYSAEADLWSVGVIAFMLCSSVKPFYDKRRSVLIDQIVRCKYNFNSPVWSNVSEDAKDFISKLIVVDPKERYDAVQALGHKWIVNRERLPDEKPSEEVLSKIDGSLLNYRHTSKLKKLALTVIAHRSTTAEMQKLRSIFQEFDKTQDGVLSFDEFRQALERMNYPEETLAEIFESVDLNQNGHIMWTEVSTDVLCYFEILLRPISYTMFSFWQRQLRHTGILVKTALRKPLIGSTRMIRGTSAVGTSKTF